MPNGFVGTPAHSYLALVETHLRAAQAVHNKNPFAGLHSAVVPLPSLPIAINETSPHPAGTADSGGHTTGMGVMSNIVVGESDYSYIFTRLDQIDDSMGRALNNIATSIETLCEGEYVLPLTSLKGLVIAAGLKNALGEYRSFTEETIIQMRKFVNEILAIG